MKRTEVMHSMACAARSIVLAVLALTAAWWPRHAVAGEIRDAQLQRLVEEAINNNPEIKAADSERQAAESRVSPAGALDDPMLEAGVINLPLASRAFRREDMTMKMLGVSQQFPYPGKRGLRREVAARDAEVAAHAYAETVNRVVRDVRMAYFDLALVVESASLVKENRRVLGQFAEISAARYAVGQGSQSDVLTARTQLARMDDELIQLERERRAIEAELAFALGRESDDGLPAPAKLRLPATDLQIDALRQSALEGRPQLLGLASLIDRNAGAVDLARREYYPDFEVMLGYGQRESMLDGTRRDDMVSLTVAVNLPVWRASKRDPGVAEAIAMRNQAADMYRAQLNEVSAQLRRQVAAAEQSLRSARLYESGILPQARLAVESSLAAYRVNRVDFLTLLDNQMTVLNYEIGLASAIASCNKALAEIEYLTGKAPP
ncbi:MAG: TolC family protein [Gammaproteobacteria bacterium]